MPLTKVLKLLQSSHLLLTVFLLMYLHIDSPPKLLSTETLEDLSTIRPAHMTARQSLLVLEHFTTLNAGLGLLMVLKLLQVTEFLITVETL